MVNGITSTYSIDHQTWPNTHTHNGQSHVFDETSPVRLESVVAKNGNLLKPTRYTEDTREGLVWRAKHLIGKEWEEDERKAVGPKVQSDKSGIVRPSQPTNTASTRSLAMTANRKTGLNEVKNRLRKRKLHHDNMDDSMTIDICNEDVEDEPPLPSVLSIFQSITSDSFLYGDKRGTSHPIPDRGSAPIPGNTSLTESKKLLVYYPDDQTRVFVVKSHHKGYKIATAIANSLGCEQGNIRMSFDGRHWDSYQTVSEVGLWDGPADDNSSDDGYCQYTVELIMVQCGGKPVIYLYPPRPMLVNVTLSLCPQCTSTIPAP